MSQQQILEILHSKEVQNQCRSCGIDHIDLIGSYASGKSTASSDVDLLYTRNSTGTWGFAMVRLKQYLESLLNTSVDMVNRKYLNKRIEPFVMKSPRISIF